MTSIYRDRGGWSGAIIIDGKRRKVRGKLKAEVEAKLAKLLADHARGETPESKLTVAEAVDTFLERGLPERNLAPATLTAHRWAAGIITASLGDVRVQRLTVRDVERMLDSARDRQGRPLSASTLRKIRNTMQQALEFAVRRGEADRNVAQNATIARSASRGGARRALGPSDARTLLEALRGERNGAMFALSLRIGLRPGEAAGLHWSDLHGSALNITRAVRLTKSRPEVVDDLKTSGSKRTIELPADLVDWLAEHRAGQVAERLAAPAWADERLVFATTKGTVISPANARRDLARICRRLELPELRPNELRHSCASLLSDMGVPNEEIADLLGHTTTRMVDQTYRHRLRPVVDVAARSDWACVANDTGVTS